VPLLQYLQANSLCRTGGNLARGAGSFLSTTENLRTGSESCTHSTIGASEAIVRKPCLALAPSLAATVFTIATIATVNISACAQDLDLAVSGFAAAPPPGYTAAPGLPFSPSQVIIRLTKPKEPDVSCDASFEVLPGFQHFSQDALNRQTGNPNWDVFYRDGLRDFYTVLSVERFDHAGVRGALVNGISKPKPTLPNWAANQPTLVFMFYTPRGLNKITCVAPEAVFVARRAEFEAVVRGVTLAR
jgi:hypothetical protein